MGRTGRAGIRGKELTAECTAHLISLSVSVHLQRREKMMDSLKMLVLTMAVVSSLLIAGCGQEQKVHESWKTPPTKEKIDDSSLNSAIKAALQADPEVRHLDIRVEAHAGTIMLSGFAESEAQLDRINMLTWMVEGVKKVDNKIDVRGGTPTAD